MRCQTIGLFGRHRTAAWHTAFAVAEWRLFWAHRICLMTPSFTANFAGAPIARSLVAGNGRRRYACALWPCIQRSALKIVARRIDRRAARWDVLVAFCPFRKWYLMVQPPSEALKRRSGYTWLDLTCISLITDISVLYKFAKLYSFT